MTLCESAGLYVAGKRSFGGCGFRSGCPVVSVHGCDTVNHAVITHAQRRLHGHGTHTYTQTCACSYRHSCVLSCSVTQRHVLLVKSCDGGFFSFLFFFLIAFAPTWSIKLSFFLCCHILKDSTVIMIVLLVMTKVIT